MTFTDIILLTILYAIMFIAFKFMNANITITYKQEFSEEDRNLLQDLYDSKGDIRDREHVMMEALDEAVRNINSIILDSEEDING